MTQQYVCENCGISGSIRYRKHADVYTVLNAVTDDHDAKSPTCSSHRILRVRNNEVCTPEQWAQTKREAKAKANAN